MGDEGGCLPAPVSKGGTCGTAAVPAWRGMAPEGPQPGAAVAPLPAGVADKPAAQGLNDLLPILFEEVDVLGSDGGVDAG